MKKNYAKLIEHTITRKKEEDNIATQNQDRKAGLQESQQRQEEAEKQNILLEEIGERTLPPARQLKGHPVDSEYPA